MPFPAKFRRLLEPLSKQVVPPHHVILTYVACGTEPTSCGWTGWLMEGAYSGEESSRETLMPSRSDQLCPKCGKETFRTEFSFRYNLDGREKPSTNLEVLPVEYE
jgi:hypothetical protein